MINAKSSGTVIGTTLLSAIAASLCCITPVIALIAGSSSIAANFSWIEPARPYLITLSVVVLAFAWYLKLNSVKTNNNDCNCEVTKKPSFWQSNAFLGIITVVSGLLIAFPSYAKIFYLKPQQTKIIAVDKNNIQQVVFNIKGMTCEGCTEHVNNELSKVDGVIEYKTSYKQASSIVKFDNTKTNIPEIEKAINSTGYKVIQSTIKY